MWAAVLCVGVVTGCSSGDDSAISTEVSVAPVTSTAPPAERYSWTYGDFVLDSESMDYLPVDPEAIVLDDGRVRLFIDGIGQSQIRTLTSDDGVSFVQDDVPLIAGNLPSVVKLPDGRYRMYFVRFDSTAPTPEQGRQILSAVSDDALTWIEEPGVRVLGSEPSAVVLSDGRTLLAVRRDSTEPLGDSIWCGKEPTAIWFTQSLDGLEFTDERLVIDAAGDATLEGRAYGVELARLADGSVAMHYEGCVPGFFRIIDETTLELGPQTESNLRGRSVLNHYRLPEPDGFGGDVTLIVLDGEDRAYISLRSTDDGTRHPGVEAGFDGVRQRVAAVFRRD